MSEFALPQIDDPEVEAKAGEEMRSAGFFSRLFRAEWPRLRNYLSRFVGRDEAEELAQEAFTRLYSVSGDVRSPKGLLYQTARNLLIDRQRRRRVSGAVLVENADAEAAPDLSASPEDRVALRQRLERAAQMIEQMPPKCRQVFLLQVIDGCSYAEIAKQLGISVVAVKKQLLRAFEICAAHAEAERSDRRRGRRSTRTDGGT